MALRMFLNHGVLSDVSLCVLSECYRSDAVLVSRHPLRRHMMSFCFINDDVNLYHLVKIMSARVSLAK